MRWAALGVSLLALAAGCQRGEAPAVSGNSPDAATAAPTSVPTPWIKLRAGHTSPLFEGPAQVLPSPGSVAEVMPAFSAQVVQLLVQPGQRVVVGTPLCVVLSPEVLRAAGTYLGAGLRLTAYTQRREQLLALKGEGLSRLSDQLETEARIAEVKAAQLESLAVLQAAGLSSSDAGALASSGGKITVRSPIVGVVVSVGASLGHVVQPGTALVKIVGASGQRIEARLSAMLPKDARFELLLPTGKRKPLRLIDRSLQVDGRDGTMVSWLTADLSDKPTPDSAAKDDPDLVPGMVARVAVYPSEKPSGSAASFVVPTRALRLAESGAVVLRRGSSDLPQPVSVQVLWSSSVDALVTSPQLHDGDTVAADASFYQGSSGAEP